MERSDKEKELKAFRLFARIRVNHKHHKQYYCATFTPKGKKLTHDQLLPIVREKLSGFRCIESVYIISENEKTNHFHGVIVTKDHCKFQRLFSKKNSFHFHLQGTIPLNDWCTYITKTNPTKLYTLTTTEFFNKPFITDTQLAHYEP